MIWILLSIFKKNTVWTIIKDLWFMQLVCRTTTMPFLHKLSILIWSPYKKKIHYKLVSNVKHTIKNPCCNSQLTYRFWKYSTHAKSFLFKCQYQHFVSFIPLYNSSRDHLHWTFIDYFVFNSNMRYTNITLMSFA